jgi:hypothetical protein
MISLRTWWLENIQLTIHLGLQNKKEIFTGDPGKTGFLLDMSKIPGNICKLIIITQT